MALSLREWLNRPQRTNRQAIVIGLVVWGVTTGLLYGFGWLLDFAALIDFAGTAPVWLVAALVGAALSGGFVIGRSTRARTSREIRAYDAYAEHLADAMSDLRKALSGQLPGFIWRDFIEAGLFEPAHRLLTQGGTRGDVRFDILHPDEHGVEWVMARGDDLFPALGHGLESRRNFRLAIAGSFAEAAYTSGQMEWSNRLSEDDRYHPHPLGRPGREYESMVSMPIWSGGEVDGVFDVLATEANAFTRVDRVYLGLLGKIVDVARSLQ
jgi:hypothetical protein